MNGWFGELEVPIYDPARAFRNAGLSAEHAVEINAYALERCDGLIAYMPDGVPTVGVPMEIQTAIYRHKPTTVIGSTSIMITTNPSVTCYPDDMDSVRHAIDFAKDSIR